jgi:hypothetical protein
MKRTFLTLFTLAAVALTAMGCDESSDQLTDGRGTGSRGGTGAGETAGGENGTYDHNNDPGAPNGEDGDYRDLPQVKVIGSPEITSRLHACGKLSIAALGDLLNSRGLTGGGTRPNGAPSGIAIYNQPATKAALGEANYAGRIPEATIASTSAMSKMFDIYTMASYDAVTANYTAPACPGVKVLGGDGKFTKDGISCLIGKPATDEHVAIANDVIAKNPTDGAKIAIAALLSAAHTCQ